MCALALRICVALAAFLIGVAAATLWLTPRHSVLGGINDNPVSLKQIESPPVDEKNLYYRALFAYLDRLAKSYNRIDDSEHGSRIRTDYHHMIIEKNPAITDSLPTQLREYRVEYLDAQGLVDRYKKLRKSFSMLVVHPIENEGERLRISFALNWSNYKEGKLVWGCTDWGNVYFRYDCGKRAYVLDSVEGHGP
jgi:hypothetical protein